MSFRTRLPGDGGLDIGEVGSGDALPAQGQGEPTNEPVPQPNAPPFSEETEDGI